MLTKTSLVVFIIFVGQFGFIVMSDSEKNQNIYFLKKKKKIYAFFLVAKSEKTYKKYFSHQPVLVRNGFLNKGLFAEVESTIRPLPLVRLIKSAVAPLLWPSRPIRSLRYIATCTRMRTQTDNCRQRTLFTCLNDNNNVITTAVFVNNNCNNVVIIIMSRLSINIINRVSSQAGSLTGRLGY